MRIRQKPWNELMKSVDDFTNSPAVRWGKVLTQEAIDLTKKKE